MTEEGTPFVFSVNYTHQVYGGSVQTVVQQFRYLSGAVKNDCPDPAILKFPEPFLNRFSYIPVKPKTILNRTGVRSSFLTN